MKWNLVFCILSLLALSCQEDHKNKDTAAIATESWMQDLQKMYPDKDITLLDIMMPGAHDAGVYELSSCSFGANACNTQTQFLNFEQQLLQGIRVFDVRPTFYTNKFYTEHATSCGGLGCKGALLPTIYQDIDRFLDTHAELVILEISHYCNTSVADTALLNLANRILGDKIYKETTPNAVPFIHRPLQEIIGSGTSGKVLLLYEGAADNAPNRANGLFSGSIIPREGAWTNSHTLADMLDGQVQQYDNFSNDGEHLFVFSWQITQNELQAINCAINPNAPSIRKTADSANARLVPTMDSLMSTGQIRKGRIPNILYLDFSERFATEACIKISRLNLE